jgi:hypothetical protein
MAPMTNPISTNLVSTQDRTPTQGVDIEARTKASQINALGLAAAVGMIVSPFWNLRSSRMFALYKDQLALAGNASFFQV